MPFYEYSCPKCKATFELLRPMARRDDPAPCPECGHEKVKRELPMITSMPGRGAVCGPSGRSGFS